MGDKILVTRTAECFNARLNRSEGSYDDERRHEFRVEDLKAKRGVRGVIVVFTREAIVNAGDFKSREHILYWNAVRRAGSAELFSNSAVLHRCESKSRRLRKQVCATPALQCE